MRKFMHIFTSICMLTGYMRAQELEWLKTYGVKGNGEDHGKVVVQTSDGGYVIVGCTGSEPSHGGYDVWLIKTDANGDTLWTRTYGGTSYDYGYSVIQTSDGGYMIVGSTSSFGTGGYDVWLIKTDANGDTLWTRVIGYSGGRDEGWAVQQTSDGGYIIVGYTSSFGSGGYDVWLIKTDANGDTLWMRTYGGTNDDYGRWVQQTSDGGYIIVGYTSSFGSGGCDV